MTIINQSLQCVYVCVVMQLVVFAPPSQFPEFSVFRFRGGFWTWALSALCLNCQPYLTTYVTDFGFQGRYITILTYKL